MQKLHLNIFNNKYQVVSTDSELIRRLSLDFSFFLNQNTQAEQLVEVFLEDPPWELIPPVVASNQNDVSIIYEDQFNRYNDYHGKALTIVQKDGNRSQIYALEINLAHELAYLFLLSKSGKKMDLQGYHKIHAMGLQYGKNSLLFVAPSKGGKSTYFLSLMQDPEVKLLSDDTPIIDDKGNVYPFPLRIGLENKAAIPNYIDKGQLYTLDRRIHGTKILIPIQALNRDIGSKGSDKTILVIGKRSRKTESTLRRANILQVFPHLVKFMILGIGLPMILEYFLESGLKDFIRKSVIIIRRTHAAVALAIKSEKYVLDLSTDIDQNTEILSKLLKEV